MGPEAGATILSTDELLRQLSQADPFLQFAAIAVSAALTEEVAVVGVLGLVRGGEVGWALAFAAIFVGTTLLNTGLYQIGRLAGPTALHGKMLRKFQENGTLDALHRRVDGQGWMAVAIARFVPGTRLPVYLLAGVLAMEWHTFVLSLAVSTLLWVVAAFGLFHAVLELARNQPFLLGLLVFAAGFWIWWRRRSRRPGRRPDRNSDRLG